LKDLALRAIVLEGFKAVHYWFLSVKVMFVEALNSLMVRIVEGLAIRLLLYISAHKRLPEGLGLPSRIKKYFVENPPCS